MSTIRVEELLKRKVGRFLSHYECKYTSTISLEDLVNEIKGSHWKDLISQIRYIDGEIDKELNNSKITDFKAAKSLLKSQLAAVTISGLGHRRARIHKDEPSFIHSGLLQIDLDKKDHPDHSSNDILRILRNDPYIVCCFLSPSGGVKGVCAISADLDDHEGCFAAVEKHYHEAGLKIDRAPSNPKSLCYLSHDSDPYVASNKIKVFQPIKVQKPLVHTMTQSPNVTIPQQPNNSEEYNKKSRVERIRIKMKIEERVEKWKDSEPEDSGLKKIWETMVEQRYKPEFGCRNQDLCDFIAYSICRLGKNVSLEIAKLMRELWDEVYTDPMEKHLYEGGMQWSACEYSFRAILSTEENEIYDAIGDHKKSTFRICRGLANYNEGNASCGEFFLSSRDLGARIGVSFKYASKLLNEFAYDFNIIQELQRGELKGRKATQYKWLVN